MKILVTGGNGFIGQYTCLALESRGFTPVVFDHSAHRLRNEFREGVLGDIRDATAVTEAMAHVDGWIHLAGVLGTQETIANPLPAAETNVLGGLNVLRAAAQYKVPGVNIAVGNFWMQNTYSITKDTVSRFAEMFRVESGLAVSTVRALNAYGPGQSVAAPYGPSKVRKIMPSFVMRALHEGVIEVYGDGSQIMDMIHVRDVAETLVRALEKTMEYGGSDVVYSAGTGRRTSVLDIATLVAEAVQERHASYPEIRFLPMRPGEPENSVVLGKPETLLPLGLAPEGFVLLEAGVRETVAWYDSVYKIP